MSDIPINLAVEDALSEAVVREMLKQSQRPFSIGICLNKGGYGYLKKIISGLNHAAKGSAYLVLTDLDNAECPQEIISTWLEQPKHPNLIFRIAVREVEAWLLAHRETFAKYVGISKDLIPRNADEIADPKQTLINLVRKSKKRDLKEAIVPADNSTAKIGKDYNGQLIQFVKNHWQIELAKQNSPSLEKAMKAILNFQITWEQ
ncbi:DUF4276 family protein [Ancylothrix sp. C2]|uniref:DUF4276 family protein n=1 Tax=Ancylothrix sp. D3o TaxID=2953691 RepID=UPI0021BA4E3E|nr:DUF4276 family protein [Ancylothrix sp. D3o]MCT7951767.1 DUF4276 family protein [Ancylothrix sp. D3o]